MAALNVYYVVESGISSFSFSFSCSASVSVEDEVFILGCGMRMQMSHYVNAGNNNQFFSAHCAPTLRPRIKV